MNSSSLINVKVKVNRLVNVYQLQYTNGQAQGLGDYLRGCFCLMQIATLLGIQFDMDMSNHPMSKYLMNNKDRSTCIDYSKIAKYENINYIPINARTYKKNSSQFLNELVDHLNQQKPSVEHYYTFCNSFPIYDTFTENARSFVRHQLEPTEEMWNHVRERMTKLHIMDRPFSVIHIRSGDKYLLQHKTMSPIVVKKIAVPLKRKLVPGTTVVLLSDSNQIKILLKRMYPQLIVQCSSILHLGEQDDDNGTKETLSDFFLMSKATSIVSISPYNWGSGFSKWCSVVYGIPFEQFQVDDTLV